MTNTFKLNKELVEDLPDELSNKTNLDLANSPYTTNRILEMPQDIQLELNNGTLTLKSGSKVYAPNGFEQDGTTPHFDVLTVDTDITYNSSANNIEILIYIDYNTSTLTLGSIHGGEITSNFASGTTPPTTGTCVFYNTSNNTIKTYVNGSVVYSAGTFPIAKLTTSSTSQGAGYVTFINQIFNGFGYIGSTAFLLPGVKVEYVDPNNGMNPDGTYNIKTSVNNIVRTSTSTVLNGTSWMWVISATTDGIVTFDDLYNVRTVSQIPSSGYSWSLIFNETNGKVYYTDSGTTFNRVFWISIPVAIYSTDANYKITAFTPYKVNTVNTYSRSELSGMSAPSTKVESLTVLTSGSQYIAPANGIVCVTQGNNANGYCNLYASGGDESMVYIPSGYASKISIRVRKGQTFIYGYTGRNASSTSNSFKFRYDQGEV